MKLLHDLSLLRPQGAAVPSELASSSRRRAVRHLGAVAASVALPLHLTGCDRPPPPPGRPPHGSGTPTASCTAVPSETEGPYPADGSNTLRGSVVNVLAQSGVVRSDIRTSFGNYTGTASGVPLDLKLTLLSASTQKPLADHAIYIWHCDKDGEYSLYNRTDANYLRGVQITDAQGQVSFRTVFPGCYTPRWPHVHFEVYNNGALASAKPASGLVRTSQFALPADVCQAVYATADYRGNASRLAQLTLQGDMVFDDLCTSQQMATVNGDVNAAYTATLTFAV